MVFFPQVISRSDLFFQACRLGLCCKYFHDAYQILPLIYTTMNVPRALNHSWHATSSPKEERSVARPVPISRQEQLGIFGWRPSAHETPVVGLLNNQDPSWQLETRKSQHRTRQPQATELRRHSAPVAVPAQLSRCRRSEISCRLDTKTHLGSDELPPSVAALLAMTQIPKPPRRKQRRKLSALSPELVPPKDDPRTRTEICSISAASRRVPIERLLSSLPHLDFLESGQPQNPTSQFMGFRSSSSESVPSLLDDDASIMSYSGPPTPESYIRRLSVRDRKGIPSTTTECDTDHPLLQAESSDEEDNTTDIPSPSSQSFTTRSYRLSVPFKTLRSNLTASLMQIRLAARNISNFTASAIPPDDHIARGLIGAASDFRSELRPAPLVGTPTPELRRYLNPIPLSLARRDFHYHGNGSQGDRHEPSTIRAAQCDANAAPMLIPLRTYSRNGKRAHGVVAPALRAQRLREPRENSEFLRIYVLETTMRRCGKLDEAAPLAVVPGRKAFWLPAREMRLDEEWWEEEVNIEGVPRRWVGVFVDE